MDLLPLNFHAFFRDHRISDNQLFVGQTSYDVTEEQNKQATEQLELYYKRKIALLAAYNPDGIAIETLPSLKEAQVAAEAYTKEMNEFRSQGANSYFSGSHALARTYSNGLRAPLPSWISFICKDNKTTKKRRAQGQKSGRASDKRCKRVHGTRSTKALHA